MFSFPWVSILICAALNGSQIAPGGLVYKNVFLRQGAKGPLSVPGMQEFLSPHHPQEGLATHLFGSVLKTLQFTCNPARFGVPS